MIPPVYHSLRRESIKNASSASAIGVQSVRPTWFEDIAVPKETTPQPNQGPRWQQPQPLHGLKLVIKEEVLAMKDQPEIPLALLAACGLLAQIHGIANARRSASRQQLMSLCLAQSSSKMVMDF